MRQLRLMPLAVVVLLAGAVAVGATAAVVDQAAPFKTGDLLPAWSPGTLDIHQIVTGRGNANFMTFPDGTTVLVDAGDQGETEFASQRPDASRTPAQWIARYIRHMEQAADPSAQPRLAPRPPPRYLVFCAPTC